MNLKKTGVTIKETDIKTKVNTLRNQFRKEHRNFQESNKSGSGADSVYTPTLW